VIEVNGNAESGADEKLRLSDITPTEAYQRLGGNGCVSSNTAAEKPFIAANPVVSSGKPMLTVMELWLRLPSCNPGQLAGVATVPENELREAGINARF